MATFISHLLPKSGRTRFLSYYLIQRLDSRKNQYAANKCGNYKYTKEYLLIVEIIPEARHDPRNFSAN